MGRTKRNRCRTARHEDRDKNVSNIDSIVELLRWMKKCKWKSVCEMQPTEFAPIGLRGLMAKHKIDSSETLVKIPIKLLVTRKTAIEFIQKSDILDESFCSYDQMTTLEVLAVFLLLNKALNRTSTIFDPFWKPYIHTLPDSYEVPYFCSDDEVRLLYSVYLNFWTCGDFSTMPNIPIFFIVFII